MTLSKDDQHKLNTAVAELRKLEGKVSFLRVIQFVDAIPDRHIRTFLWASLGLAACFMQQDLLKRKTEGRGV